MVIETRHFSNDLAELRPLSEWIHQLAIRQRLADEIRDRLDLCVHEAVANVIRHGYEHGAQGSLAVSLEGIDGGIQVRVADDGRAFNPIPHPPPPVPTSVEDAPIGGFGIHLMRSLSDGLEYCRKGGRNILVIRFFDRIS